MADRVWIEDAAEKGRIVKPARQNPLSDEQVLGIFGWGLPSSIWANPCECQGMAEFKDLKPQEMTERAGFLLWNAATTQNLGVRKVDIDGTPYLSLCGYKDLLPHLHNFNNSAEAIKYLEELLVDELTFHLFGAMGYSTRGLGGTESMDITGYAIRFAELSVTPKDNITEDFKEPKHPTNRVARSRIYGAILVPESVLVPKFIPETKFNVNTGKDEETGKQIRVGGAKKANPLEVLLDPKRDPEPIRKTTKPPPPTPRFTLSERSRIDKIPPPVSQFGLSPEHVREEQLKVYTIAEIEADNNLAVADPKAGLAAKLIKWRSKCPKSEILKSLKYNSYGSVVFAPEDPERGIPSGGMYFISVLTNINKKVHPDPEFLYFDGEHDETIESCVRSLYNQSITQQEVIKFTKGPLHDSHGDAEFTYDPVSGMHKSAKGTPILISEDTDDDNDYDIIHEEHQKLLIPPQRDLYNLADDVGYLSAGSIPEAYYEEGKKAQSWIVTVGIQTSKLEEAEESEYSDPNANILPPQNKFDWIPMVGQGTWKVRTLQEITIYRKSSKKSRRRRSGLRVKELYYYAYVSDEEYLSLKFDTQKMHDTRDRAVFKLYESLPSPRRPDYRVADFKFAPMPFSGKAVVLVAVRKDWIDNQPYKKNSKPKKLPPVVKKPKLKNNARPFLNWQHTHAPFPTWHDSNRESYYSLKEAQSNVEFMDAETGKIDLKLAEESLGSQVFQDICSYYGKVGTPVARITDLQYYQYFKNRNNSPIDVKTWLPPKPYSSPRAIVGVREEIINNLPAKSQIPTWQEIEKYNDNFIKDEKYLILRVPVASHHGVMSFWRRMQVTAKSLRDMAKGLGRKKSPQGLTAKELRRASHRVGNFLDDFNRTVLHGSELRPDPSSPHATESIEKGTACEFYLYLDPKDFSVKDVFAYTGQRCTTGVAEFKALWSPPHNVAMQFVFWSGMTYVKTNHGRSDKFDFFDMMSIMFDPMGALGDWMKGFPDIPGLPDGFVGQALANEVEGLKSKPPSSEDGFLTAKDLKDIDDAVAGTKAYAAKQIAKRGYYKMNPDTSNPGATHEDPNDFFDRMSAAGCGQDMMTGILSKVNIFSLIMMYLKCLGIELPIDPRCLFTFPWPLFDLNIVIPWFTIPPITLADILEIIRKVLYQMLCALIIELMLMLVKEILEAVLALPGCAPTADGMPQMPEAPFDFGPFKPRDLIEDALNESLEELDPLDPDKDPDDFTNKLFGECQPGLQPSDYGPNRSALTYFTDVSKILTGVEFCSLMQCVPNRDVVDRVIRFTKEEYPDVYYKKQDRDAQRKATPDGSYIGWPREPGSPAMYRNFWCCLGSVLKPQVNDICDPDSLVEKYGQPRESGDDKCITPLTPVKLNDRLKEIWKDRGLSDEDIKEMIEDADKEITKKLMDMDAIQASIDEFLEVEVPKVTAPVVDAILMNAFDQVFKPVAMEMRSGVERIKNDAWEPDNDLLMMINYVVNAKNLEIGEGTRYYRVWRRRGWWWYSQKKYYRTWWIQRFNWLFDKDAEVPDCRADPIFLHDKFKVKTQVWPPPWYSDWIQDSLTWFVPRQYEQIIPGEIRSMYKNISLRDNGEGAHNRNVRAVYYGGHKALSGRGMWRDSRWWRDKKNLQFLRDYAQDLGNLADTAPSFFNPDLKNSAPGVSERLEVGNGKFAFSVELDKNGDIFTYDLYEQDGQSLFDKEVTVKLDRKHINEKGDDEPNFPWWHNRKVTKSNDWIQRDEFFARFVDEDHPIRNTSEWSGAEGIRNELFRDMHTHFYEEEIKRSIIEPLRRSPMESFWLEELYRARNFEEWDEFSEEELVRNRVFNSDDPYIKMADIRQQAKEILESE